MGILCWLGTSKVRVDCRAKKLEEQLGTIFVKLTRNTVAASALPVPQAADNGL